MKDTKGNTNTGLLVVIIIILVGFGAWYVTKHSEPKEEKAGIEINVPAGNNGSNQ